MDFASQIRELESEHRTVVRGLRGECYVYIETPTSSLYRDHWLHLESRTSGGTTVRFLSPLLHPILSNEPCFDDRVVVLVDGVMNARDNASVRLPQLLHGIKALLQNPW